MISSLIDAELSPAEKEMLEKHLNECTKCRSVEEWLKCVKEGIIQSAEGLALPSGLRDKILASLPERPPRQDTVPWWRRLFVLLVLIIGLSASPAFSWGPEGHEYINKAAALKAPVGLADFPSFFQSHESIQIVTYNGPEPDRWKSSPGYNQGKGHSLAHYINLDSAQDLPAANDHIIALQMYQKKGLIAGSLDCSPITSLRLTKD